MQRFLASLDRALADRNWCGALIIALILPDDS